MALAAFEEELAGRPATFCPLGGREMLGRASGDRFAGPLIAAIVSCLLPEIVGASRSERDSYSYGCETTFM